MALSQPYAKSLIERFYQSYLGRDPVFGGPETASYWLKQLTEGTISPQNFEKSILSSDEYKQRNPSKGSPSNTTGGPTGTKKPAATNQSMSETEARNIIKQKYNSVLEREPIFGGEYSAEWWIKGLMNGQETPESLENQLKLSNEYNFIIPSYKEKFGRLPSTSEIQNLNAGLRENNFAPKDLGNIIDLQASLGPEATSSLAVKNYRQGTLGNWDQPSQYTPPTGYSDNPSVKDTIIGMYKQIFDRTPAEEGLSYWTEQVNKGMTLNDVKKNLENSVEAKYIQPYFRDILGRSPTQDDLDHYNNKFKAEGYNPDKFRQDLELSKENLNYDDRPFTFGTINQLTEVYRALLGREPDPEGLKYWQKDLERGVPMETIIKGFLDSPEKQAREAILAEKYKSNVQNIALQASKGPQKAQTFDTSNISDVGIMDPATVGQVSPQTPYANTSQTGPVGLASAPQVPQGSVETGQLQYEDPNKMWANQPATNQNLGQSPVRMFAEGGVVDMSLEQLKQQPMQQTLDPSMLMTTNNAAYTAGVPGQVNDPAKSAAHTMQASMSQPGVAATLKSMPTVQGQLSAGAIPGQVQGELSQGAFYEGATGQVTPDMLAQAAQGQPTQQTAVATMDPNQLAQLDLNAAQIDQAQQVQGPGDRNAQQGEILDGQSTVDMQEVMEQTGFKAAQAQPADAATVQGQLASLMQDFEGDETPAWAAGALRNATAQMQARGLGASSIAGQALVQAAMESAIPIAAQDANTFAQYGLQNLNNRQQAKMFAAEQRAKFLGIKFDQQFAQKVYNADKITELANTTYNADVQIALENARLAQTADIANLDARNAKVMADSAAMTQIDIQNLVNTQGALMQDAQLQGQMDIQNLQNRQQSILQNAQTAAQMGFTNLANLQAAGMQGAELVANMDFQNLQSRLTTAVETSKNFLQMDMANLDVLNQQTMFKSKENINSILTDQAAENASKQFNATSKQQQQQFFDSLTSQVKQFNASQYNAMEQFNTGERNSMSRFNSDIQNQREMFNAQNSLVVSQANAQWRQNIATLDMQAQNAANMEYAKFMNGMAAATLDQYWQRERDILDYSFTASESAMDRGLSIFMEDLRNQGQMAALDAQSEIERDASKRAALGRIAGTALDWGLEAVSSAGWF